VNPLLREALTLREAPQIPVNEKPAPPPPMPAAVGGNVKAPLTCAWPSILRCEAGADRQACPTEAVITVDGSIRTSGVRGTLLAPAAIAAVKEWRYTAPTLNGQPIEVIMQVDVNFELSR
jgi:hypothetical protein